VTFLNRIFYRGKRLLQAFRINQCFSTVFVEVINTIINFVLKKSMKMNWKILLFTLFILVPVTEASAQKKAKKISLSGYVVDASGIPVPDAMFFVDGTKISAVSKPDGSFKFKVNPDIKTVMAYSLICGGNEIEFTGETVILFELGEPGVNPEGPLPEEIGETVNIGYGTAKKDELTSSVGSVDKYRLQSKNYTSIYQMIAGEVAGVSVSGNSIRIRGVSSMNASNEPLFVVNGSPVNSIDNINPNDVESIDILKGSSTAIYGSRGTNGVILIKLKTYKK